MKMSRRKRPVYRRVSVALGWIGALLLFACGSGDPKQREETHLTVFAAASLQDLVKEAAREWTERTSVPITFSFAGSNTLAQQIVAAPGADVFLSADDRWMDRIQDAGRLREESRRHIWRNTLVLVGRHDAGLQIETAEDLVAATYRHLAVGDPDAVPAGRYAKAALEHAGIWSVLVPRIVPSSNVRAALALVESDPEILGIVYRTDAATSSKTQILWTLPPVPGLDIVYSAAALQGAPPEAEAFLEFLSSPDAAAIAASHGFLPTLPEASNG